MESACSVIWFSIGYFLYFNFGYAAIIMYGAMQMLGVVTYHTYPGINSLELTSDR